VGKHLGLSAVLTVMLAIMTGVYLALLSLSKITYPLESILVSQLFLGIELALLIAVAMLFGVFTSSILATLFSFGIYLMGHISSNLLKLGALSKNETVESITQTIYLILPDLERLNLKNQAVYGLLPSSGELLSNALYGILYAAFLLSIAILIFSRREF
jgi:ABC-type transport system involved in multi-copper enzyme maturation permease subunit